MGKAQYFRIKKYLFVQESFDGVWYNMVMLEEDAYTIRQASDILGVPTKVLRRFCDEGSIRHVRRKRNGYRILNKEQLEWAGILANLERCGFNELERKTFARLAWKGDKTLKDRKAMLETKKRNLWQKIEDLQAGIDFVERQVEVYDQKLLEGK